MEQDPHNDDEGNIASIRHALDQGVTHIDTAEIYAAGHAEELVGRAIQGRDRSALFLASKIFKATSYDHVIQACMDSLKRLSTDYLDLYMLHRYSGDSLMKETMRALDTLKTRGYIKNIGVSNFTVAHLQEAQHYSQYPVVCNQVHYNLEFREPERAGLHEYCQANDVMVVAFRPIQRGLFDKNPPEILLRMCEKYHKTPTQIAVAWLVAQENVVVVSKTGNPAHLTENLGSLGWSMTKEDVEMLRKEYPNQKDVSDAVPLQ